MTKLQYKASSPQVEASGASILSVTSGMATDLRPLLEKHGLDKVEADQWYPQQSWLNFLAELTEGPNATMINLVGIGMSIAKTAHLPPQIDSLEAALMMLNAAYHMNNRNDDPERGWKVIRVSDKEFHCLCSTPVPRDFEYGVVYGFVRRFSQPEERFVVYRTENEDGTCLFRVVVD